MDERMQKTLTNLSKLLLIAAFLAQGFSLANAQSKSQKSSSSAAVAHTEVDMQKFKPGVVSTWFCESNLQIKTANSELAGLLLLWNKKIHSFQLVQSLPGSQRFHDADTNLDFLVIPDKAMLFDAKAGQRLVDYCKTEEMRKGGQPPAYNNL